MASQVESAAMSHALQLARSVGTAPDPNPRVGAVILDSAGAVVGVGAHRGAGTPHAEVVALAEAGQRAHGGTAVITLEPCAHTGRTGPCTKALLAAGVRRVVYAQTDPNPAAAGGAGQLRAAGLSVEGGLLAGEAADLNREWTFALTHGRPFVTWKVATTLDGRVAAADGTSRWISSPAARADAHTVRARVGAILVGTGTVLADDPQLTVRDEMGRLAERQPLRVVLGRRPVPPEARVRDDAAPTLLLGTRDPSEALSCLARREVRHVLLEGGPTLAAAFLTAGLVDEVLVYLAPLLLGAGPPAVGDLGVATLARAHQLQVVDVHPIGPDVRVTCRPDERST
jgi:diaminohydroxyphosphoribosylaminopyrimidine deaminase/5-amino-6-(5-phosphoribosylamino)uracil reductase